MIERPALRYVVECLHEAGEPMTVNDLVACVQRRMILERRESLAAVAGILVSNVITDGNEGLNPVRTVGGMEIGLAEWD